MRRRLRTDQAAFALVECTIATAVSALFLGSLFLMNSSAMGTIQLARESACASQVLQQIIGRSRGKLLPFWPREALQNGDWIRPTPILGEKGRICRVRAHRFIGNLLLDQPRSVDGLYLSAKKLRGHERFFRQPRR